MINTVLFLDTETSGVDPKKDHLVEVACVLWSVQHACTLACWSTLVIAPENPAEHINRIPAAALAPPYAAPETSALQTLRYWANSADVIIAHHAEFDRSFLPELGKPWICSQEDLTWPNVGEEAKPGTKTLVAIALANDVAVAAAHRALTDCVLLARCFERIAERGHDLQAMLTRGLRPKATFQAIVSFERKDDAKKAGFHWESTSKRWMRTMALEDAAKLPFRTVRAETP